jgi:hypothetical protein
LAGAVSSAGAGDFRYVGNRLGGGAFRSSGSGARSQCRVMEPHRLHQLRRRDSGRPSAAAEPALALLKYFTAPSAQARWQAAGLELAGE